MPHSHFLRGTTSTRTPRRTSGRRLMRTTVLGATVALVAALLVAGSSATATETSSLVWRTLNPQDKSYTGVCLVLVVPKPN